MSSDETLQTVAPAISFREYRDEEIVDFFANGQRTFHPVAGDFGRKRIVGSAHSQAERKPTAAFRSALAAKHGIGSKPKGKSVLCGSVPKTVPILPREPSVEEPRLTFGKQAKPLGSVARKATSYKGRAGRVLSDPVQDAALKLKEQGDVEAPCTNNPGISLDNGIQNFAERPTPSVDAELAVLIARWPRLSSSLKEIIGTLIGSDPPAAG